MPGAHRRAISKRQNFLQVSILPLRKSRLHALKDLNRVNYQNIVGRVKLAENNLLSAQNSLLQFPTTEKFETEIRVRKQWNNLKDIEEKFFRQKSRVQWLASGDSNTRFFHRSILSRQSHNRIRYLENDNGIKVINPEGIREMVVNYYQNLLGRPNPDCEAMSPEDIRIFNPYRCSTSEQAHLAHIPTADEIKDIVFHMPNNKAPGPDGYSIEFYKSAWSVIGSELCEAVRDFFTTGHLLKEINASAITLIPKVTGANKLRDFRPISCCNTLYKIISTVLARRIQTILPHAVQLNQAGFIKGRLLGDNVLLAAELINNFHKPSQTRRGCLKIDLAKAYDNVNWTFLLNILTTMDFPQSYITWIGECISTPTFSINLNGQLVGFFPGAKGLRQGDPISSSLFVLVMDILGKMLDKEARNGMIKLPSQCSEPLITHLAFADDLLVFFDGSRSSLHRILQTLDTFYTISGLKVNCSKTVLFLDGNNHILCDQMANHFGIASGCLPVKYLGLPLTPGKLRAQDYEPLLGKIKNRLTSWLTKHLSYAGRLQLIRSVLNSTINFWATVYTLPVQCANKLDALCRTFLWSGAAETCKGAKISWEHVCTSKQSGGLGLKQLAKWNKVLNLKLIWRLHQKSESMWVRWAQQHLIKNRIIWEINFRSTGSWYWRNLMKLRPLASQLLSCKVNSGTKILFWYDKWLPSGSLISTIGPTGPTITGISSTATVSTTILNGHWQLGRSSRQMTSRSPLHIRLRQILPTVPPTIDPNRLDHYLWCDSKNFSVRRTRQTLFPDPPPVTWHKAVWFKRHVPKHAFLLWLTAWGRLNTRDRLRSWGVDVPATCLLCNGHDETIDHLFINCIFAQVVWRSLLNNSQRHGQTSLPGLLSWMRQTQGTKERRYIQKLLIHATIYEIWREINARIFTQQRREIPTLIHQIQQVTRSKLISSSLTTCPATTQMALLEVWFREFQTESRIVLDNNSNTH